MTLFCKITNVNIICHLLPVYHRRHEPDDPPVPLWEKRISTGSASLMESCSAPVPWSGFWRRSSTRIRGTEDLPFGIFRFPVLPQIGNKQPENAAFEIGTPGNEKAVSTGCRRCSLSTTKTRKKHRQSVAILSSWINAIPFSLTFLRMGNEVKD